MTRSAARRLARHLKKRHKQTNSWRQIAREDYGDAVSFATLNKIVVKKGEYVPKDARLQVLLGLKRERRKRELTPMQIRIREKADELRQQLKAWRPKRKK